MLTLQPINLKAANNFVVEHHRHHKTVRGQKFSIACMNDGRLCGVVIVSRPVNRYSDDGFTAEVTRNCTDGTKNACSMLYSAAWRAAKAMGYRRIITYTLESEPGTSLKAAGWVFVHETEGGTWDHSCRPRPGYTGPIGKKKMYQVRVQQ